MSLRKVFSGLQIPSASGSSNSHIHNSSRSRNPPTRNEMTLTWGEDTDDSEIEEPEPETRTRSSSVTNSVTSVPPPEDNVVQDLDLLPPSPSSPIPFGSPPGYSAARVPLVPVKYQFSPLGTNAMVVLPPPESPDTRPLYHISVQMNCFMPFSFITSVRRGGTEHGEFVGEFEMGITRTDARLYIDNQEMALDSALTVPSNGPTYAQTQQGLRHRWAWSRGRGKHRFIWDEYTTKLPGRPSSSKRLYSESVCHSSASADEVYAKLYPRLPVDRTSKIQAPKLTQLEVYPNAYKFLDDLVMSALVLERWRLTPAFEHIEKDRLLYYGRENY